MITLHSQPLPHHDLYYVADPAEHGRDRPHHPGSHRFQNQTGGVDPRPVAAGHQRLLQRLLDRPRLQAHARLPKVRLFPDHLGRRRLVAGGGARTRRRVHG